MIEIKNLSKVYKTSAQEVLALDNVNLSIKQGEIFGIIGLSGAGKSTLIRCINLLETPSNGSIFVDGQEITKLDKNALRNARMKIAMIFQHFNLLSSRNVIDNVIFPLEIAHIPYKEAKQKALKLLDLVGIADKAYSYPQQLSGGQKQRVAIARALANDPRLLLSDEATSALDPETTRSILKLLKDINKKLGLTIVLITHDMNVIKQVCDRVAVMSNSQIVEVNDVLQIFSNPGTPTSKSFINAIVNKEIPDDLLHLTNHSSNKSSIFIRVSFIGSSAGQPLISSLIRKFDVEANILYGNIDRVKDIPFGNLTLELIGETHLLEQGMAYLKQNGLEVEVLEHV